MTHALGALLALLAASAPVSPRIELMPLFDFQNEQAAAAWRPVHDSVMGGLSDGRATAADGAVRFEGTLSLENNGGFASFRAEARESDLSSFDGVRLRVRGDGQIYKLNLRTDGEWDGVSWRVPFATVADEWITLDLAFEELVPTWRGRLVSGAPPFDASSVRQVGIQVSDKQAGPYALELAALEAWRDPSDAPGTRAAARARTAELAASFDAGANAGDLLVDARWRERWLVVSAPSSLDELTSAQIGRLLARGDDLAARELRIVYLMGSDGGRLAGRTLTGEDVGELREAFNLPAREWSLALVGKDGDVKALWASLVDPDEILERIDGMPVREREVRERQ